MADAARFQRKVDWMASSWKRLIATVVVITLVAATIGLIYSQPLSKIKVVVYFFYSGRVGVLVYIDGNPRESPFSRTTPHDLITIGEYSVVAGIHNIQIDNGWWDGVNYIEPDGNMNLSRSYKVGPLFTQTCNFVPDYVPSSIHYSSTITPESSP